VAVHTVWVVAPSRKDDQCLFLVGLDQLEVPRLGEACQPPQGLGTVFPSCPRGFVELTAEGGRVWSPPRFGVVGGSGDRCVFSKKGSKSIERPGQPCIKVRW